MAAIPGDKNASVMRKILTSNGLRKTHGAKHRDVSVLITSEFAGFLCSPGIPAEIARRF
jgi:hypothetical protein